MSLKEITADLHTAAESTDFMKAVFARSLPRWQWIDWTYQKTLFYGAIEGAAGANRLLGDLPDIRRAFYLYMDFCAMNPEMEVYEYRPATIDYYNYILSIRNDPQRILAHLYVWHMGDLFGGQMIKRIVEGPHRSLEFADVDTLKTALRTKLTDDLGDEARVAFEWAIRLMNEYSNELAA